MAILSTGHKVRFDLGNFCNLDCPSCFRQSATKDYNSKRLEPVKYHPYLNTHYVTRNEVERWFPEKFLGDHIEHMLFCGASSEPTLNPEFVDIVDYFSDKVNLISMSTNGSTRNADWWYELGKTKIHPIFSIDSLKPDNNLYRIGSNTDKILENMRAFTAAGGKCTLKHILFKHNQDEIDDFIKITEELNCRYKQVPAFEFTGDKTSYEVVTKDKTYTIEKNTLVQRNKPFRERNPDPYSYCLLTTSKTIIVHANGVIYPCCHIEGEFFKIYEDFFIDENNTKPKYIHKQVYNDFVTKIEKQGGIKTLSLRYNSIEDIMNSPFFRYTLEMSWKFKSNTTCINCKNWKDETN